MRTLVLALLCVLTTLPAFGQTVTIQALGDHFVPDSVHVSTGDTVRFVPEVATHAVKLGAQEAHPLEDTLRVEYVFPRPGLYPFVCTIHAEQGMDGVILVTDD